jgi:hypothetical protein
MGALHNVRLVSTDRGVMAVPYDFDFSGLVDTRYAAPSAQLPIRNVRQRLYRGPCLSEAQVTDAVAHFAARRGAIRALYDSLTALDRGYARSAISYLDDFYDQAKDPRRFAQDLRGTCVPGS